MGVRSADDGKDSEVSKRESHENRGNVKSTLAISSKEQVHVAHLRIVGDPVRPLISSLRRSMCAFFFANNNNNNNNNCRLLKINPQVVFSSPKKYKEAVEIDPHSQLSRHHNAADPFRIKSSISTDSIRQTMTAGGIPVTA